MSEIMQHTTNQTEAVCLATSYKAAMRRLAASVTIVTSLDPVAGVRCGMTATAVTSLTADPPALPVCVSRSASMHPTLAIGSRFCVNVLGEPHAELARAFGGQAEPLLRFKAAGEWGEDAEAVPFLTDAVVTVFCQVDQLVDYASHSIVIGRVSAASERKLQRSLIWADGGFAQLSVVSQA